MRRSMSVQVVGSVKVVVVGTRYFPRGGAKAQSSGKFLFASLRGNSFSASKQPIHILLRVEDYQIVDFFADAGITNRQVEFFCNGDGDSAFGGAVEFG